jgi:2'-hydroxyisoflavone reductase
LARVRTTQSNGAPASGRADGGRACAGASVRLGLHVRGGHAPVHTQPGGRVAPHHRLQSAVRLPAGDRGADRGARMAHVRLLILGGSWFVGSEVAATAASSGHDVTVFNRGRTPAHYPAGVQALHGDRESLDDLARLAGRGPWDAVVDVAGSVPTVVRDAARALREQASRYVFISTVSVYREWPHRPVVETAPMHQADPDWDPGWRHWDAVAYGPLKSGCEAAIRREFPDSSVLIFRPSVVLGPGEYVGRVPWWLRRFERGGRILAPGRPERSIQPVDVRDLASFVEKLTAQNASGVFNVAPPEGQETYGGLLAACATTVNTSPAITWVDENWLATQGVKEWTELPLWRTAPGTWAMDSDKALRAGLTCRPLAATVADVWNWMESGGVAVPHERSEEHGITSEREAALLAAWDAIRH